MALLFRRTKHNKYKLTSLVFNQMSNINNVVVEFFPEAKVIASGFQGSVYELSKNTVIKAVIESLYWQVASLDFEPVDKLAMEWANSINGLVVEFKDHIEVENMGELIAMERVYPCVPTAFTREQIVAAIEVAEQQLEELWNSGFAHCDLKRPEFIKKAYNESKDDILFNNIVLTEVEGQCIIRLIDVGTANLEQYDIDDRIDEHIAKDRADWEDYKNWVLNYPRKH